MRPLTIDKQEVNGSIDTLIDILNRKFESMDKHLERIDDKLDAQHKMLLTLQYTVDDIKMNAVTHQQLSMSLQSHPTRKEMDERFEDLGKNLNTRFDKIEDKIDKTGALAVDTANKLNEVSTKLDKLIADLGKS